MLDFITFVNLFRENMALRILFITYKRSKNILEGGGQGSKKNFECLSKLVGADNVTPYYIHDEYKKKTIWNYFCGALFTLFNYYYGLSPRRVRRIVKEASDFDVVFIDRSIFGIIAKKLKQSGYNGKIITYFHNVEKIYFDAKLSKRIPFRSLFMHCIDVNDRYSCIYSHVVIALNSRDGNLLHSLYDRTPDYLIPVALPDRCVGYTPADEMTDRRPLCLFLGTYFKPNNQGILWFVNNVLPHVDIQMRIIGKGMAKLKAENACLKDIEVLSDVPDLDPYLKQADIMILPVFDGSGMKVKTCESLMYGKNIIATSEAFEGYTADYDRIGAKCDTPAQFIEAINAFCKEPRPRFNQYSRSLYLSCYSNESIMETFKTMLESIN